MDVLSMGIMGFVSVSLICLFTAAFFFFHWIYLAKKIREVSKKPPKTKKKRRRWKLQKQKLTKQRKSRLVGTILLGIGGILFGAIASYGIYYQSINLSSDDEKSIVSSYYLLRDFQQELESAGSQSEGEDASQQNIRYLATSLAAFTTTKASAIITTEGQSTLNRYYASLAQLGLNATRESANFYGNPTLVEEFQTDISKTIEYETAAFDYFKINQAALESEGAGNEE